MKNLTEIVCVLDRSGSMASIIDDAIGGFNTFLQGQKEIPGEVVMSVVLFDDQYDLLYQGKPLAEIPPFTPQTYVPRGSTALLDALGKTITEVGKRLAAIPEAERPAKILFVILTDGYENASRKFSREQINQMITHQRTVYSWEFLYLAANQDAFLVSEGLGISRSNALNFVADAAGTEKMYKKMSRATHQYRALDLNSDQIEAMRANLFANLPEEGATGEKQNPDPASV